VRTSSLASAVPERGRPVNHVTAALLDLTNIVGGFLLAAVLLAELPRVGPGVARAAAVAARATAVIGVLALVMGGYYLILHLTVGPHVFHFELVGIGVGVAALRDRLFPRTSAEQARNAAASAALRGTSGSSAATASADTRAAAADASTAAGGVTGGGLLLAVFGLIAMVVGIQGLFTPDG
jgi:hypothetical protein